MKNTMRGKHLCEAVMISLQRETLPKDNPDFSKDPLSLLVTPKTIQIDPEKLILSDVESDDIFTKKYQNYLIGKINGYITRISLTRIKPGFYRRVKKNWEHIIDDTPSELIEALASKIRGGYRPTLYLYQNINKKSKFDFVCPDDVVAYRAYHALGISKPPAIVLGSKRGLEESALTIRGFDFNPYKYLIYSFETINRDAFPSLLGTEVSEDISSEISKLESNINTLKNEFRKFHSVKNSTVNYHQILYSTLVNTSETLKSIRILLDNNLIIQSANLVRSLYELTLNFYLYWLSPHEITKIIQLSSVNSENQWRQVCEKVVTEKILAGVNSNIAEKMKEIYFYQYKISTSVITKSRVSPCGELYYREIYSFLSKITHHDLSMSARYKESLEFDDSTVYDKDVRESILRIVDLCTTNIFIHIKEDIS